MVATNKTGFYSSLVWLFGGVILLLYCLVGLFKIKVPGVEELVLFISNMSDEYIFLAAFLAIFVEGLYIVGTFFPGSTLIGIMVVVSQGSGVFTFLKTIIIIFVGWSVAGAINIYAANLYRKTFTKLLSDENFDIKDRSWSTWFPAFRSNYEVAQVVEGGKPWQVFLSSLRVKLYACIGLALFGLIIPYFINIKEVSNEECLASLVIIGLIMLFVGVIKFKAAK